jgi:hypothetical protein
MSNGGPRRSVFGSVFLVLVGTLFLIHNFRPDLIDWRFFGKWWPLLLILWGVIRLVENLGGSRRRGLHGGEIFLLILLVCAGLAISYAPRFSFPDTNPEDLPFTETADVTEELPPRTLEPGAVVSITTPQGDISVDATGDEKQLRVLVRKMGYAMSEDTARARATAAQVRVQQSGKDVSLEADPRGRGGESARVSFEVHLPRTVGLDLRTGHGDVHVNGVNGNVSAGNTKGDMVLRDIGGDVRVELGRGDARVSDAKGNVHVSGKGGEIEVADVTGAATIDGEFYGPITARNVAQGARFVSSHTDLSIGGLPGRMTVEPSSLHVEDAAGPFLLTTSDKTVSLEGLSGRIRVQNKRGEISLRLTAVPKEEIDLSDDSGTIELALPSKSAFEISAASRGGDIENDISGSALKVTREGNDSKLEGKVGTKGPKITLNTSYGPIRLKPSD